MSINTNSYAAFAVNTPLAPYKFERRTPRANDVVIEILYCGVCHSDLHRVNGDWSSNYPLVPGHEIIGRVIAIGNQVTRFDIGENVGVGCMVDSCQQCSLCKKSLEQYCTEKATFTYNSLDRHDQTITYGGYSDKIVVADNFVLKIPQGLDLKSAAPLLCAGITTWSPLRRWKIGKDSKVAVIGLGGLGHMALKLAKALGAAVTLFSHSPGKENDARLLGADNIIISSDKSQMAKAKDQFDLIIDTIPCNHDLNPYTATLAVDGTLVVVGFLGDLQPTLDTTPLVLGRRCVAGSLIGGLAETQELLDFCGKHSITADVEMINIQDINLAYAKMLKSDVKYRFVIDMSSLKNEDND